MTVGRGVAIEDSSCSGPSPDSASITRRGNPRERTYGRTNPSPKPPDSCSRNSPLDPPQHSTRLASYHRPDAQHGHDAEQDALAASGGSAVMASPKTSCSGFFHLAINTAIEYFGPPVQASRDVVRRDGAAVRRCPALRGQPAALTCEISYNLRDSAARIPEHA